MNRRAVSSTSLSNRSSSRAGESPPRSTPSCCYPQRSSLLAQCSRTSARGRGRRRPGSLLLSTFGTVVWCLNRFAFRLRVPSARACFFISCLRPGECGTTTSKYGATSTHVVLQPQRPTEGSRPRCRFWELVFQGGSPPSSSISGRIPATLKPLRLASLSCFARRRWS